MSRWNRDNVEEPICLKKYKDNGETKWRLDKNEHKQVSNALFEMQGGLCAYCETPMKKEDSHIEHFIANRFKSGQMFDWRNLFLSCNNNKHCGKIKDDEKHIRKLKINDEVFFNLIKPDEDNPNDHLVFLSTGQVRCRSGSLKGQNTIDVFELNSSDLVGQRKQALARLLEEFESIDATQEEFFLEYFESFINDLIAIWGFPSAFESVYQWTFDIDS